MGKSAANECTQCRVLRIAGLVQGVGYRAWFEREARALGLAGWVRNRRDGSVEALVRGAPDALDAIAARAAQGPASARVAAVAARDCGAADPPAGGGFACLPTL